MKILQLLCYILYIMFCWKQTVGITDKVGTKKINIYWSPTGIKQLQNLSGDGTLKKIFFWKFCILADEEGNMSLLSFQQKHKIQEMHTLGISLCIPPSVSVGANTSVRNRNMSVWRYEECFGNHQELYLQSALNLLSHNDTFCQDKI